MKWSVIRDYREASMPLRISLRSIWATLAIKIDEVHFGSYFPCMRSVDLKVLKNRLRDYIRFAAAGETVLVTDDNRVIAEIVPPQPGHQLDMAKEDVISRGIREGWIMPAKNPSSEPLPRKPVMSFEELMKGLDESRADRDFDGAQD
jgi:antitoxin (DNA-binding transcriptional repressor) of toxin-antitoxin stability system